MGVDRICLADVTAPLSHPLLKQAPSPTRITIQMPLTDADAGTQTNAPPWTITTGATVVVEAPTMPLQASAQITVAATAAQTATMPLQAPARITVATIMAGETTTPSQVSARPITTARTPRSGRFLQRFPTTARTTTIDTTAAAETTGKTTAAVSLWQSIPSLHPLFCHPAENAPS
ncbi:MAG: hypothetical protein K0S22_174 [Oscillospiraceae bacterium]|nr:hypothetical protein [Oscillospiraceae bacterium]